MLADDGDGACPSAEGAKNPDIANTAKHPLIDERIAIAGFPFVTRNPPYVFNTRIPQRGTRFDRHTHSSFRGNELSAICR